MKTICCFLIIIFLGLLSSIGLTQFHCKPPCEEPFIFNILRLPALFFWTPAIALGGNIFGYILLGLWWYFLGKILCFLFQKIKFKKS